MKLGIEEVHEPTGQCLRANDPAFPLFIVGKPNGLTIASIHDRTSLILVESPKA